MKAQGKSAHKSKTFFIVLAGVCLILIIGACIRMAPTPEVRVRDRPILNGEMVLSEVLEFLSNRQNVIEQSYDCRTLHEENSTGSWTIDYGGFGEWIISLPAGRRTFIWVYDETNSKISSIDVMAGC